MATTITQQASDFTNRDFDSWVIELRNRASAAFPGWTDFNCYAADTYILTPTGWKLHHEIDDGEPIAAFDQETGGIKFIVPTAKHAYPYSGQLIHVHSRHLDVLVTPNHRMLIRRAGKDWDIVEAESLVRPAWVTFRCGPDPLTWSGRRPETFALPSVPECGSRDRHDHEPIPIEDWLEFLGYFVSDGSLSMSDDRASRFVVRLAQKKEPQRTQMQACLDRLGWNYSTATSASKTTYFTISNRCLRNYLVEHCGRYALDRRLPEDVLSLDAPLLRVLYEALMAGDGHRRPRGGGEAYYTSSSALANQVQAINTLLGYRTMVSWGKKNGLAAVSRSPRPPLQTIYTDGKQGRGRVDVVDYEGEVFCYEVPPYGLFVTQRNGRVGVNGNSANFGNILLEMFAHTLDVLSFTQDQQHLERFIVFARLRRSMINLGKNVGFDLPGATVSTVDLEITIADGLARATDIVIPKGTVVTTTDLAEDVEFDLTADATITAGLIQNSTAAAENAREQSETFVADGTPNQAVQLGAVPYVDGSGVVTVGPDTFTEVDDFLQSGPTDKHYFVSVDEDDRGTFNFGDGINGEIPSGAGAITYKTGGGSSGNVDANTLVEFRDGNRFPTLGGEEVQLTVRNPSAAAGGVDRMSVEEARVAIPASLRTTGDRSVTQTDFEDNARKVRGVARSMMLTSDDVSSIPENTGELYIVPVGGGLPSAALKTEVFDFIQASFPPTLTFTFSVEDPVLTIVSVDATVFLNQGVTEPDARAAIEASLEQFFSLLTSAGAPNEQIDFGFKIRTQVMPPGSTAGELPFSDLFNAVRDAPLADGSLALRKVDEDLFTPTGDVILADTAFPVLGTLTLTNGDTLASF